MERSRPRVERIAHRGAPREFRENTLPAFERAIERGADAIELDVRSTADGVVVVHHDAALTHTVDAVLEGQAIESTPWSELQAVQLAPGITVPSLSQVLDFVRDRAFIYVEIKQRAIEELVIDTIRRGTAPCAIHSFDHEMIGRASRLAPDLRCGILLDELPTDLPALMAHTGARDVWPHWRIADQRLVDETHARGGRVLTWTVNTRAVAHHVRSLGVDGICSDDLRLLDEPTS